MGVLVQVMQAPPQQRMAAPPSTPMNRYVPPPQSGGTPQSMRRPGVPQPPGSQATVAMPSRSQPPRKKRRYADKLISSHKLDAVLTKKKLDMQEALKRPQKVKRRLRIYISHTFTSGKEPEKEGDDGQVPMWELRVEGRLLDETTPTTGAPPAQPPRPQPKRKFSSFFKSLVIELDKEIYGPDNHLVEWHRTPQTNETDGFQVKRPGDRPVKCTILLLLDYNPMKFKLHPRLAKVLGIATETRPKIIEALWQYIKTHKLQDPTDRDTINNDTFLEQCFNCKRMRFMEIPQRLHPLLQQPDPLVLSHIIQQTDNGGEKNTACYDIDVEVDDPTKQNMAAFVHSQANTQEIMNYDQKIYDLVEQVNEWKTRRDFYVKFSSDPVQFIRKWLASQSLDYKAMTEANGENEGERRVEHYYKGEVQEGVFRYLYNKIQQKRSELEASLGVRNN